MFSAHDLLDLDHTAHRTLFDDTTHAWEALPKIRQYLKFRLKPGIHGVLVGRPFISNQVYVGAGTVIEHGAMIQGPAWIGEGCHIRNGAYIRENVVIGDGVVIGNSSELKNALVFNEAQVPHFNYVGDSILGYKAHLGAGVILSNVRLDKKEVTVVADNGSLPTGLRKFGALIGDRAEIGCNAVLSPGSVIGRDCIVYPGSQWRGSLPNSSIAKFTQDFRVIKRRSR